MKDKNVIALVPFFEEVHHDFDLLLTIISRMKRSKVSNIYIVTDSDKVKSAFKWGKVRVVKSDYEFSEDDQLSFACKFLWELRALYFDFLFYCPPNIYLSYDEIINQANAKFDIVITYDSLIKLSCKETLELQSSGRIEKERQTVMTDGNPFSVIFSKKMLRNNPQVLLSKAVDIMPRMRLDAAELNCKDQKPKSELVNQDNNVLVLTDFASYSGIGGFTSRWHKYKPNWKLCSQESLNDLLRKSSKEINCVIYEFYKTWNERSSKFSLSLLDKVGSAVKKVFIVHEINYLSTPSLREADFLIFINRYQKFVAEEVLNIKKPNVILNGLPRLYRTPFIEDDSRPPLIYMGGHAINVKNINNDNDTFIDSVKKALNMTNDSSSVLVYRPVDLTCGCSINHEILGKLSDVLCRKQLKDRFVLNSQDIDSYDKFFSFLKRFRWAYMSRPNCDLSLEKMYEMYEAKDPALAFFSIGESGTYRDCSDAGCSLLVEPMAHFVNHFEGNTSMTHFEFSELLEDIIYGGEI